MGSDERLVGGYSGRMLAFLALGNGSLAIGMLVLSPMLPTIIDDLGISPAMAGVALSLMWGLNALGQYPGGRLSDQLSRRALLVGAMAGTAFGLAFVASSLSFAVFLVGLALVGGASGFFTSTAYAQLSDLFVERRGSAFGVYTSFWDVGGVVSAGLAVLILAVGPWQWAFLPVVVLVASVGFGIHATSREPYALGRASLDVRATLRRLFGNPRVRLVLLCYSLYLIAWQGAVSFLPTFLQVDKGIDPWLASGAFAALFGVGIVVKPVSGNLADRVGRTRVALASLVVGVAGLALLAVATTLPTIGAGVLVFAAGLMGFSPAMLAYVMALFPSKSMGGDFGGVRTVYLGVGSLGPTFVGVVAGTASYTAGFLGLLGCLVASALVLLYAVTIGE